jgi:hypothetical protein
MPAQTRLSNKNPLIHHALRHAEDNDQLVAHARMKVLTLAILEIPEIPATLAIVLLIPERDLDLDDVMAIVIAPVIAAMNEVDNAVATHANAPVDLVSNAVVVEMLKLENPRQDQKALSTVRILMKIITMNTARRLITVQRHPELRPRVSPSKLSNQHTLTKWPRKLLSQLKLQPARAKPQLLGVLRQQAVLQPGQLVIGQ